MCFWRWHEPPETKRRSLRIVLRYVRVLDTSDERELADIVSVSLNPSLLVFIADVVDKLRWDDSLNLPITKVCHHYVDTAASANQVRYYFLRGRLS